MEKINTLSGLRAYLQTRQAMVLEGQTPSPIHISFRDCDIFVPSNEDSSKRQAEIWNFCKFLQDNIVTVAVLRILLASLDPTDEKPQVNTYNLAITSAVRLVKSFQEEGVLAELKNYRPIPNNLHLADWTEIIARTEKPFCELNKFQLGMLMVSYVLEAIYCTGQIRDDFSELLELYNSQSFPEYRGSEKILMPSSGYSGITKPKQFHNIFFALARNAENQSEEQEMEKITIDSVKGLQDAFTGIGLQIADPNAKREDLKYAIGPTKHICIINSSDSLEDVEAQQEICKHILQNPEAYQAMITFFESLTSGEENLEQVIELAETFLNTVKDMGKEEILLMKKHSEVNSYWSYDCSKWSTINVLCNENRGDFITKPQLGIRAIVGIIEAAMTTGKVTPEILEDIQKYKKAPENKGQETNIFPGMGDMFKNKHLYFVCRIAEKS